MFLFIFTLFALIAPCFTQTNLSQPVMIYNWNRHSTRMLRDVYSSELGAQLLPSAYDRLYIKGQNLRSMYPNLLSNSYNPNEIYVNSSGWQRTISTAYGILAGLYQNNDTRQIPVISTPWYLDHTIYNYVSGQCPKYDVAWANFMQTGEWSNRVQKYSNLTSYLNGLINPSTPITLANIFSTFDAYWIQRNRPEAGVMYPNIDDYTYNMLTEAAYYTESTKYSSRVSGSYLGSTGLGAILYRMNMFKNGNKMFSHKWNSASGHYATILNLLAALGYQGPVSQIIPDYNSVLTFELFNNTGTKSNWGIRIVYHDGTWVQKQAVTPIILPQFCDASATDCLVDYDQFWSTYKTKDLKQWCSDCGNMMELCAVARLANSTSGATQSVVSVNSVTSDPNSVQIAVLVICAVILLFAIINFFKKVSVSNALACGSENRHTELAQV
jgi:hypothetical protein